MVFTNSPCIYINEERMSNIVIYGTGLIAEVAHFYFVNDTDHEVLAFTNSQEFIDKTSFQALPVVPFEDIEKHFPPDDVMLFIAIGYNKRNKIREMRYLESKAKGYSLATYLSSKAAYFGAALGENCFVLENNVIQPFVTIANNVTLWSGNHIGHHSRIMDNCFISSHVVVSGSCIINKNCFLGVNCTLRDNLVIGERSVIGAGALVMDDCPDDSLVVQKKSDSRVFTRDII
jgi:sugar O-acyltransferase (sialic acid O-acetyltransferase NeuD family)